MASILKIGERWRAQIRKQGRSISKTFRTKAEAQAWAKSAEIDIETPRQTGELTVGHLIKEYREAREKSGRPVQPQSNEEYMLRKLDMAFAEKLALRLTPWSITAPARARRP